ncbi:hypothetical protein CVT24_007307 [Panaeolus cyanescens]|uniref:Uncharacterized protein n=1 Tax=Panaeolus cyanescens TaxID=181874 RepID=A0A409VJ86_9AGAR|nr:hypothetical protein CVT24_007307 [Panaeolus cyanescens]
MVTVTFDDYDAMIPKSMSAIEAEPSTTFLIDNFLQSNAYSESTQIPLWFNAVDLGPFESSSDTLQLQSPPLTDFFDSRKDNVQDGKVASLIERVGACTINEGQPSKPCPTTNSETKRRPRDTKQNAPYKRHKPANTPSSGSRHSNKLEENRHRKVGHGGQCPPTPSSITPP